MRILYVSSYFPPETGAGSARVHELSREWVRRGHQVEVLTGFASYPLGVKSRADRWRLTRREDQDGIGVIRAYVYAMAGKGVVKRVISYASFLSSAIVIGAIRARRPDVVVGTSPHLLSALAGYVLARIKRAPFVFEVRDLWPESILAVEAMGDNFAVRRLKDLVRYLYRHSERIVTVGEGYRRSIAKLYGISPEQMDVVTNGIDAELFVPGPAENEVRREYGWGKKFVIMYLGTHGMAHALHRVLEAARALREEPDKLFVLVGEGAEKARLKELAAEWKLPNVQFIEQQPKARVPLFYSACDLGLVTLRATPLFQEVLPSKIFEYLAMERSLLISVDGEARRLVETAGAGEFVPPEEVGAMVEAIRRAAADPGRGLEMGRRGRRYEMAHYDRGVLAGRYLEILTRVSDEARRERSAPAGSASN